MLFSAVRAIVLIAIAFTPLCLMNGIFLSHDVMPKAVVVLGAAALLLFLAPAWAGGLRVVWQQQRGRYFLILAIAQALSLTISTIFSTQPLLSLAGTVWRRFGMAEQMAAVLIAIAATCIAAVDPRWRISLFRAMSMGGGVASLYALAQYFGLDPFLDPALYRIEAFGGILRPPATLGHAIYFSAWLAPIALLALAQAAKEKVFVWKRVHAVVAILAPVAILFSGSRGGVLALFAGLALLAGRSHFSPVFRRNVSLTGIAMLVAAGVFTVSPFGINLRHRLYQWGQDPGGPRTRLFLETPTIVLQNPLAGTGPETFAAEFRKIESTELSRAYPDFYHETPHNAFLDVATGQGIPGLLILVALFGVALSGSKGAAGTGIESAVLAILVSSLFGSFSIVESVCLWTLCGLAAVVPTKEVRLPVAVTWMSGPATLLGCAFIALGALMAIPDAADVRLLAAVNAGDMSTAPQAFDLAQRWTFRLPGYQLWRSREMAILARNAGNTTQATLIWKKALDAATDAKTMSEEPFSAALQCSILAIVSGDLTRAESEARQSVALAPNWYKPHLLLGQILAAMGRTAEGTSEQQTAANLNPKKL